MKKINKKISGLLGCTQLCCTLLFCTLISGCSTMEFVNGPQMEQTVSHEKWHHLAIFGLIELSKPLDVNEKCDDKQWDTITVEKTFFNAVADASYPALSLYTPWTIMYECRQPID